MNNINLPLSCPVENIRLDNVMYMNIINDVSCLVDGKIIVLAEHQSTINENMPGQRMYFHVHSLTSSFEYNSKHRKLKPPPSMAAASMIKNVHPCTFFIYEFDYSQTHYCLDMPASCRKLYAEDYPETTILKLSDAFITKPEPVPLELTVQVLNINTDKAHKVLTACKPLEEYSLFVEEVRKQMQLDSENGFTMR